MLELHKLVFGHPSLEGALGKGTCKRIKGFMDRSGRHDSSLDFRFLGI